MTEQIALKLSDRHWLVFDEIDEIDVIDIVSAILYKTTQVEIGYDGKVKKLKDSKSELVFRRIDLEEESEPNVRLDIDNDRIYIDNRQFTITEFVPTDKETVEPKDITEEHF